LADVVHAAVFGLVEEIVPSKHRYLIGAQNYATRLSLVYFHIIIEF